MEINLPESSKDYFSNLNALSKKISVDIENTREAYQEFWHILSKKEQDQVIDESIICPSAVIKYASVYSPVLKDNPNTFSWFTKSQLDLFNPNEQQLGKIAVYDENVNSANKLDSLRKGTRKQNFEPIKGNESCSEKGNMSKIPKPSVLKPKNPPPPPPSKNRLSGVEVETVKNAPTVSVAVDLPKTGFDFLDNW